MSVASGVVEVVSQRPDGFALRPEAVGNVVKYGSGAIIAAGSAILSVFKARHTVDEGTVAFRTFNDKVLDRHGRPLHDLLQPGAHWMLPFLHGVVSVNTQTQSTALETKVDLPTDELQKEQYVLEAAVMWGIKKGPPVTTWGVRTKHPSSTIRRPTVAFDDAFAAHFGVDSYDDQELIAASVATGFLALCARELVPDNRNADALTEHANNNLAHIIGLDEYGLRIYGYQVTNFSVANILQFGGPVQVQLVSPPGMEELA